MGICAGGASGGTAENNAINKVIQEGRKKEQTLTRVLLLGSGEAGKTTFLKQILYFHPENKQQEEMVRGNTIFMKRNVVSRISLLACELDEIGELPKDNEEINEAVKILEEEIELTPENAKKIAFLWSLPCFKQHQATKYDGYEYFLDKAEILARDDYKPTRDDILRTRVKTSGVQFFEISGSSNTQANWMFIDVSGQRSERRKWIHAFEGVKAVIYLSSLSSYDMMLEENDKVNRMDDDLTLFESVSSIQYLPNLWIFFQNKSDLFREKIKVSPISKHFPDIDKSRETDFDYATQFFRQKFEKLFHRGPITFHTTCALDSKGLEKIYDSIQTQILNSTLRESGLM
eukprot:TRINITY_DN716_c0_g2_i1.p1 TRINITY_DN716_c0_g2~~TRINITY_DN716_c0_g2_i1.p1  ORF type:complete len:346 (-),score=85.70 TRINITY_DN716_c0_g2_i1:23-1060(-)